MLRIFLALFVAFAAVATADPVLSMPGLPTPLDAPLDAGYITVNAANNRSLFYMFAQSKRSPSTDPVVLWLNGGPGCSSLAAMFTEHGLFTLDFDKNGTGLKSNPYAWANVANVIYLESPAGVGFSYSGVPSDYNTGDVQTAEDSYNFLLGFFSLFPQFKKNDFYVTGESYGGHYVPELVDRILQGNANPPNGPGSVINIVGLMAGNPWTAPNLEAFPGVIDYWWNHGIISKTVYESIYFYCDYKDITFWIVNNVTLLGGAKHRSPPHLLKKYEEYRMRRLKEDGKNITQCFSNLYKGSITQFGNVDILGIYTDVCVAGTKGDIPDQPNYCGMNQLTTYLNLPAVQAAIHVRNTPKPWTGCSSVVQYSTLDTESSMMPLYEKFVSSTQLKILVFSGDNDAIVPFTGSRAWIEALQLPIVNDLHEWFVDTNGQQVGGWATQYSRLTFTTVRGAGHMVPFAQPERALAMFQNFLANGKL